MCAPAHRTHRSARGHVQCLAHSTNYRMWCRHNLKQLLFDANGMIYMMRYRYHGRLENYMVQLCDIINVGSLAHMGVLSLLVPIVICMLFRRRSENYVFNHHRASVWRLGVHIFIYTMSFTLMGIAYWATYPMAQSCDEWAKRQQNDINSSKSSISLDTLIRCDTDYLHAFLRHGVFTSLSGIGWFTRMTIDPIIDLLTDKQLRKQILITRPRSRQHSYLSQFDRKQSYCLQNMSLNVNETLT
uniref:G_PROTEIN_RECEP_F1_2 domain-containing protein n=1 Tax=Panagrellus redivivus TaxID=6233 RepID=A0A7E4VZF9_PANRE